MPISLLKTKVHVPPVRSELVPRPRLIKKLRQGLIQGCKLVLLSAPAGYGKTTLLSSWVAQSEEQMRVAWVSLGEGDNDPATLMAYIAAALRNIQEEIGEIGQGILESLQQSTIETATIGLLNQIAQVTDPVVLVLDDYHVINAIEIHQALAFLLENMPPQMHLVLATRADPPLPIPRWRGRGQLVELYESDLRFTPDEAAEFLEQSVGLELSAEDVAILERRTEGWIAGLQMAALSMRGRDDIPGFVRAFAGSHRYIIDYLGEEVLRQQGSDAQEFLLQTAILDRLSGPLCDAVAGGHAERGERPRPDAQAMLEYLERNNLFVVALDDERRWYRYHHLFADLLRQRLQRKEPELVPELHRRAGGWYEASGLLPEAIDHLLAAADFERAADLVDQVAWPMVMRGACTTLLGWINAFPDAFAQSRPRLGVFRAWCLMVTGQLDDAERLLTRVDVENVQGEAAAFHAYAASIRGDTQRGIEFAQRALAYLPEDNLSLRGFLAWNLGIAYFSRGEPPAAARALSTAIELSHAADQKDLTLAATATLGHVQDNQALLRQAVATHKKAIDLARRSGNRHAPVVGVSQLGIAEVLYEWNDLDGALDHVTQGLGVLERARFVAYLLFGHSVRAQICSARGDLDGAQAAILEAKQLAQGTDLAYMTAVLDGLQVRLNLARGDIAAADQWAREQQWTESGGIDRVVEAKQMAVSRVLVARGELDGAIRLLADLLEAAQAARRMAIVIEVLVLQALAFQAQDNSEKALAALERALSLAEPEGYVRTFLDEGEPMAILLRQALSRPILPNYVARLLAAFGEEAEVLPSAMDALVDPLTERELEVLRLVVAGLSNPEIADELFIAVSTVKSHINRIYSKLGVDHRTQAVATARKLGLLQP